MGIIQLWNIVPEMESNDNHQEGRVYSVNGLSPTIRNDSRYWIVIYDGHRLGNSADEMGKTHITDAYGLSRTRDRKGKVIKRSLKPYVNTIHTLVASGHDNMWVLVVEIYDEEDISHR